MADNFFLKKGERGLLVGQTGSGKTQNALFHLRNPALFPVIMLDTKIEPAFFSVPDESDSFEVIENLKDFHDLSKRKKKEVPDYTLVRPSINEMQDPDALDTYNEILYHKFGPAFIYYDELYQWHNQGKPGNNFLGLLTRGRAKGKTVLMATQRPSWISRFCFTEANKFFIHSLSDLRDRKTLDSMVPNYSREKLPPKYHFHNFVVGQDEKARLFSPVDYQESTPYQLGRHKWI